jgi:hypothetical protein
MKTKYLGLKKHEGNKQYQQYTNNLRTVMPLSIWKGFSYLHPYFYQPHNPLSRMLLVLLLLFTIYTYNYMLSSATYLHLFYLHGGGGDASHNKAESYVRSSTASGKCNFFRQIEVEGAEVNYWKV